MSRAVSMVVTCPSSGPELALQAAPKPRTVSS